MLNRDELTENDCKIIVAKIKTEIFEPAITFKKTIFLCGKDISDQTSFRYRVAEILTNGLWYSTSYDIVYPEDIFDELLYGSNPTDLLTLENLLADSVDAVVVIPESAGSFTELGAFANNEKLRTKMICVLDIKYKGDKSFINQGPVKLVKRINKEAVVYIDENKLRETNYNRGDTLSLLSRNTEIDKIVTAIKKVKKSSSQGEKKITLLQLDRFLLPVIYLLEPISKNVLIKLVSVATEDLVNSQNYTSTALSMLTKKKYVEANESDYKLTALGKSDFFSFRQKNTRNKQHAKTVAIDDLRLEILNLKYRNKKLKVG